MEIIAPILFLLVYLGMFLGSWPGLALDRTGIALLGAIAFIGFEQLSIVEAASYIDFTAIAILFSFMIISAQFYFSGFYSFIGERMGSWNLSPPYFLLIVILISATLSALLINDIVCLALAPILAKVCFQRKLNPIPFLIALACSSNIGSGLTLIGNPQNLLIGQVLNVSFTQYIKFSFIPCLLSLLATWIIIRVQVKGRWFDEGKIITPEAISFDPWQCGKGIFVIVILLFIFIFTDLPRDEMSLIAAGFLLLSRKMASQTMLSFIDWQLLVLFVGLFIINKSFLSGHDINAIPQFLENFDIDIRSPIAIITGALILSNIVSNVPAAMLMLPLLSTDSEGSLLALSSTFAGNMFIVGSIANLIVASQAAKFDIKIDWKNFLKIGFPVSIASFVFMIGWLYFIPFIS